LSAYPRFSIIIPTFNRAELIRETIDSISQQTYGNWECIVVDDGSTDNTREIIEEFSKTDPRIKYVHQENAERSAARNNGIEHAKGEWICFLDSDDHFLPENLSEFYNFIQTKHEEKCMLINQALIVSSDNSTPTCLSQPDSNPIEFLLVNPVTPSRVCVHRDIVQQIRFDEDIVIVEDAVLWLNIATNYPVYVSNHIGVKYHLHDSNSVNRKGTGSIKMYKGLRLAKKKYPETFKKISRNLYRDWMSRIMTNIAFHHLLNRRKLKAVIWILKAILIKPMHEQTKYRINLIRKLVSFQKVDNE
jgi:glycosyltransferase involved in cell wall biosynthesis